MLTLDIVTPSRKVVEGVKADFVKMPATKGQLEVLPGHTDLLTLLTTGPLSYVQDGKEKKFSISFGFAEIRNDKVMVFAETVEEATDVDLQRAQTAQKRAEQALLGVLTEEEFKKHQLKLERSIIRQHISS